MKKRIFSILLVAIMIISLIPAMAFATEPHNHGTGGEFKTQISDANGLQQLFTDGGSGYLAADITTSLTRTVAAGKTVDLCLSGHVIKYENNTTNGSVIKVESGATLNLYDCDTRSGESAYTHEGYIDANGLWHLGMGGYDESTCTLKTITGGIITGGEITGNGKGGGVLVEGTFNMHGGTIAGNNAGGGGAGVYVSAGTFNMYGGTITCNKADSYSGGVYVNNNTTFAMSDDGVISNNKGGQGAGVYSKGTFTMSGNSEITGNTGSWGGGVHVGGGTFTMSESSKISYNTGTLGGGVCVNSSTFTMTGGSIDHNTVSMGTNDNGGGVYANGSVTLGGTAKIIDNVSGGAITKGSGSIYTLTGGSANNLFVPNGKSISLGNGLNGAVAPASGMSVGVTMQAPGNFTSDNASEYIRYFTSDNDSYYVAADGSKLKLAEVGENVAQNITTGNVYSTVDNAFGAAGENEEIRLIADCTTAGITVEKNITLDLNGKVLKPAEGVNTSVIKVNAGGNLTLIDSNPSSEHKFAVNSSTGLWTLDESATTAYETVLGGVITGGSGRNSGGGVHVGPNGTFNMSGGNVAGNTVAETYYGGGVYVNGTFNMSGGSITGNTSISFGGGVYVSTGTDVTLGGTAKITDNIRNDADSELNNNLFLPTDATVALGTKTSSIAGNGVAAPAEGMSIGVTTQGTPTESIPNAITSNGTAQQADYFHADKAGCYVNYKPQVGDVPGHLELLKIPNNAHQVTIASAANGAVYADKLYAAANNTVTITVMPASGYRLKAGTLKVTYNTTSECAVTASGAYYTFTMPEANVVISAEFEQLPTPVYSGGGDDTTKVTVPVSGDKNSVNVSASVSGSTATVKKISDADLAKVTEGESVSIDLSGAGKNVDTAKLPTETIEKIAEKNALSVKLPAGAVEFDKTATEEIVDQAKGSNIELVVDDIKETSLNAAQKQAVGKLDTALIIDAHLASGGSRLCTEANGGFGGGKAKVVLPYEIKNDRKPENYSVFYAAENGTLEKLNAVYDTDLKAFVFEISHFSNYVVAYNEKACPQDEACVYAKFTDANTKAWYHDGVHFCVENGLMNGVADDKFAPSGTLSRGMIVTMLWRMEGEPVVNYAMSFKDVKADKWYTEAIRWAAAEKIVSGYDAEHFGPSDLVTREQLATILYNYAKSKGQGFTGSWMFLLDFADRTGISSWADEAVHWCSMKGIVNGKTEKCSKIFDPQGNATRAEAAAMVQRFCEALEK